MNRDYAVVFPVAALMIMLILGAAAAQPGRAVVPDGLGRARVRRHAGRGGPGLPARQGRPGLIFLLPIYIYLFVVALGTDYNILMIARLREEARAGGRRASAAAEAVKHAGPTVAAAGLILAGTFASLMLGGNALLIALGFSISFGIFVAAFVMAMFFTPALTALIGHAAWWPGHGDQAPVRESQPPTHEYAVADRSETERAAAPRPLTRTGSTLSPGRGSGMAWSSLPSIGRLGEPAG